MVKLDNDIITRGVLLIAYMFVIIVMYLALSSPFDDVFTEFENLNMSASDTQVDYHTGNVRIVFDLCFALAGIIPIVWFIVWVFSREPDWRYYQ